MLRKLILPIILISLGYGFWLSENFKEIVAGISIFLFGMLVLEEGFKTFSGGVLEKILKISTNKIYKSVIFGFVTTTLMQSSSLVSVITISFLGAGLIELIQGIGIIYGANIGTTTGSWLMAGFGLKVKISAYAMPLLVFGIILIFQKSKNLKGIGYILAGLGFLFLGIHYMKEGFETFKDSIDLSSFGVIGFKGILVFIGIGVAATVVMQSSHATIILVIAALASGQISYENAIALTIGANIGTTITAIIGSLSSNIEGKRLAGAHFIFNIISAVIAIIFIAQIMQIVDFLSNWLGIDQNNFALKLAVFDTFFKVMGVVIIIPFTKQLVYILEKTIQSRRVKRDSNELEIVQAKYLNNSVLELPSTAFAAIIKESKHLYDNAFEIIVNGMNIKKTNLISTMEMDEVLKDKYSTKMINIDKHYMAKVKPVYGDIIDFSTRAQFNMPKEYINLLYKIKLANRDIVEAIKDTKHLQKNLKKYLSSPNKIIRQEYNNIRKNIAFLLRDINIIATSEEEDVIILLLSKVKIRAKEYDILANGKLDNLIRKNLITNEMATSLMNDSSYVSNISRNLIEMAENIFVVGHDEIQNLSDELMVDDEDIDSILVSKDSEDGN